MFTEELAREVGVAYGLYCAICKRRYERGRIQKIML